VSRPAGRRLIVTSAAATDLTTAHDWYENQSAGLGAEFLRAVDVVLANVQRTPTMFPAVHGLYASLWYQGVDVASLST